MITGTNSAPFSNAPMCGTGDRLRDSSVGSRPFLFGDFIAYRKKASHLIGYPDDAFEEKK
jgi:hypothetical protein